jgi:hypothetical protein
MMHLIHHAEIVWREQQRELEREAEYRRRALEAAGGEARRPLRQLVARLARRLVVLRRARRVVAAR